MKTLKELATVEMLKANCTPEQLQVLNKVIEKIITEQEPVDQLRMIHAAAERIIGKNINLLFSLPLRLTAKL